MADESKALKVQKETALAEPTERTRECQCFIPRADIYETDENIVVVVDMPGVDKNSIDITLDKNILTINGYSDVDSPEGYSLVFAEYEVGDYERSFRLSDHIDGDKIEAAYKDGVLHLTLPKAEEAKARKISVKTG
ncbi:MAG: Hsp20/alpha crystallin family protein [Chloroflexota bacterium]